jgi:hypothetical protein
MLVFRFFVDGGHPPNRGRRQGQRFGTLTAEAVNAGWRLHFAAESGRLFR